VLLCNISTPYNFYFTSHYTLNREIYFKDPNNELAHYKSVDEDNNEFVEYLLSGQGLDTLQNINGRLLIGFTVNTLGDIVDIKVFRGVRIDIDNLVTEILKNSPKWIPSTKDGKKVDQRFVIPINIQKKTITFLNSYQKT